MEGERIKLGASGSNCRGMCVPSDETKRSKQLT